MFPSSQERTDRRSMITYSTSPVLQSPQHQMNEVDDTVGLNLEEEEEEEAAKPTEEIIVLPISFMSTSGNGSRTSSNGNLDLMNGSGHRINDEEVSLGLSSGMSSLDSSISGSQIQQSNNELTAGLCNESKYQPDDPAEEEKVEDPMFRSVSSGLSALMIMQRGDQFKSQSKPTSHDTSFSNNSTDNSINLKKHKYKSAGEMTATTEEGTSSYEYSHKSNSFQSNHEFESPNTPVSHTLSSRLTSFMNTQSNHSTNMATKTHVSNTSTWASSFENNDSYHGMISVSSNESSWRSSRKNKNNRKIDRKKKLKENNRSNGNPLPEVVHTFVTNRGEPSKQGCPKSRYLQPNSHNLTNDSKSFQYNSNINADVQTDSRKCRPFNQNSFPNISQQNNPLQFLNSSSNFVGRNSSEKAKYQMFLERKCQYQQQQYFPRNTNFQFNQQPIYQYPPNNSYNKKSPQVIIPHNSQRNLDPSSFPNDSHSQHALQAISSYTPRLENTCKGKTAKLSFSTVEIRFYRRALGDNPSCSNGPPVAIDWEYDKSSVVQLPLDYFENMRAARLEGHDLVLCREEREEILENIGYSRLQIAQAVRTNIRIKNQRRQTIHNLAVMKVEEAVEKASRKMKKMILRKGKKRSMKKKEVSITSDKSDVNSSHGSGESKSSSNCEESKSSSISLSSQPEEYKNYITPFCKKSNLKKTNTANSV